MTNVTTMLLSLEVKEAKHDGVRYPCDQCEYTATTTTYQVTQESETQVHNLVTNANTLLLIYNPISRKKAKQEGLRSFVTM